MISRCGVGDFEAIFSIINDAAEAYRRIIPEDRWKDPYMPREELQHDIDDGIAFFGYREKGELIGVMGIQDKQDVTLIRHAYVRTQRHKQGIGSKMLAYLEQLTSKPILIGTWADATWAIGFYQKHGYQMVTPEEKDRLLRTYWTIPERQVETSVVLANEKWFRLQK